MEEWFSWCLTGFSPSQLICKYAANVHPVLKFAFWSTLVTFKIDYIIHVRYCCTNLTHLDSHKNSFWLYVLHSVTTWFLSSQIWAHSLVETVTGNYHFHQDGWGGFFYMFNSQYNPSKWASVSMRKAQHGHSKTGAACSASAAALMPTRGIPIGALALTLAVPHWHYDIASERWAVQDCVVSRRIAMEKAWPHFRLWNIERSVIGGQSS